MARELPNVTVSDVLRSPDTFVARLQEMKASMPDVNWYPYSSISNLPMLSALTNGITIPAGGVLDVGAADGDLSFLFAEAGSRVDALECIQPNFNKVEGLRRLNDAFGRAVSITLTDLDFGFTLPRQYDFCLALGIAYHLRNPLLLYINLAQHCRFMVTNTRVIDGIDTEIPSESALAYFLGAREVNNDPTNFWFFTPAAYRRVLKRCGWRVIREEFFGAGVGTLDADKRMWAVCERVPNHADLRLHHDF